MSDLRLAAEMAYEVPLHELLEDVPENARLVIDSEDGMSTSFIPIGHYCKRAAMALRQALAQPGQEPVAWMMVNKAHGLSSSLHWKPQEDWHITWECKPLYTAPPKREWVGINKEDKKEILEMTQPDERGYVIAITEAKLKEKNK